MNLKFALMFIVFIFGMSSQADGLHKVEGGKSERKSRQPAEADAMLVRFDVLQRLLQNSNEILKEHINCGSFEFQNDKGELIKRPTLGQFVAWNLAIFKTDAANNVKASCVAAPGNRKPASKICEINFISHLEKDESPWACGLRYEVDAAEKIDLNSLACIGSC